MTIRTLTGLALGIGLLGLLTGPSANAAAPTAPSSPPPASAPALASIKTALPAKYTDLAGSAWLSYDVDLPGVTGYIVVSCQPSTSRPAWRVAPVEDGRATIPNVLTKNLGWPVEIVGYAGTKVMARTGCVSWVDDVTMFGSQYQAMETGGAGGGGQWGTTGTTGTTPILAPADSQLAILPSERASARPAFSVPTTDPTVIDATTTQSADPTSSGNLNPAAPAPPDSTYVAALTPAQPSTENITYTPVQPIPFLVYVFGALALLLGAVSARRLSKDRALGKHTDPIDWAVAALPAILGVMAASDGDRSSTIGMSMIMIILGIVAGATLFGRIGGPFARIQLKHLPSYVRNGRTAVITVAAAAICWALGGNTLAGALFGALIGVMIGAGLTGRQIILKQAAERAALSGRLAGCFGGSPNDWLDGTVAWNVTPAGGLAFRPGAQQVARLGAGFEDRAALIFPEYVGVAATSTLVEFAPVDADTAAAREHLVSSGGLIVGSAYVPTVDDVEQAAPSFIKTTTPSGPATPWTIVDDQETTS
jgi:hypothetical protein